jgi:hypothetical protein
MEMSSKESGKWEKEMGEDNLEVLMDTCKLGYGMMINFKFEFSLITFVHIYILKYF